MPSEKSIRVQAQQAQVMPNDVGILDQTFITPTGKNAPSLFSGEIRDWIKLLYKRIRLHGRDYLSLLILKISSPQAGSWRKRKFKIHRKATAPAALALHKQMYSHFAEADVPALRKICTDGLFDSFSTRIASRARGERVEWELVRYNGAAKVVSHRAARIPNTEGMAIRQAVVRVSSRQKLTRSKSGKGGKVEILGGSGKEKDVVEYLVVQRFMRDWKEGEWRVWGTTGETSLEDVELWDRKAYE